MLTCSSQSCWQQMQRGEGQSSDETYPTMQTIDWDNTPSINKYTAEASAKVGVKPKEIVHFFIGDDDEEQSLAQLIAWAEEELKPEVTPEAALIRACEKGHKTVEALDMDDELLQQEPPLGDLLIGLIPDAITHNTLISACAKGNDGDTCIALISASSKHLEASSLQQQLEGRDKKVSTLENELNEVKKNHKLDSEVMRSNHLEMVSLLQQQLEDRDMKVNSLEHELEEIKKSHTLESEVVSSKHLEKTSSLQQQLEDRDREANYLEPELKEVKKSQKLASEVVSSKHLEKASSLQQQLDDRDMMVNFLEHELQEVMSSKHLEKTSCLQQQLEDDRNVNYLEHELEEVKKNHKLDSEVVSSKNFEMASLLQQQLEDSDRKVNSLEHELGEVKMSHKLDSDVVITDEALISACEKGNEVEDDTALISACEKSDKVKKARKLGDLIPTCKGKKKGNGKGKSKPCAEVLRPSWSDIVGGQDHMGKGSPQQPGLTAVGAEAAVDAVGLEPNATTYAARISACAQGNRVEKAFELFAEMQQLGVAPDVPTYNAIFSACEKGNKPELAMDLFLEMLATGLKPNAITHERQYFVRAYLSSTLDRY